jgi:hypothetical protein
MGQKCSFNPHVYQSSFEAGFDMRAIAKRLIAGLPATAKSTWLILGRNSLTVAVLEFNLPVDQVWPVLQSLDYSVRHNKFLLSCFVV